MYGAPRGTHALAKYQTTSGSCQPGQNDRQRRSRDCRGLIQTFRRTNAKYRRCLMRCSKRILTPLIALSVMSLLTTTIMLHRSSHFQLVTVKGVHVVEDHEEDFLCLFTTFKPADYKIQVYQNVLFNWMSLAPRGRVRAILYDTTHSPINYNDTKGNVTYELPKSPARAMKVLVGMALSLGWNVYNLSQVSPYGVPYFKDMFFDAAMRFPSCKFFSYANGDIMFDHGLVKTLKAVDEVIGVLNTTLLIGRRTNVAMQNLSNQHLFEPREVAEVAVSEGQLGSTYAIDYFVLYRNRYPWRMVPDVVIGRRGYDNFIVGTALDLNVSVIEITNTTIALHQTDSDGNAAGFSYQQNKINAKIIGKYNYYKGSTKFAKYHTQVVEKSVDNGPPRSTRDFDHNVSQPVDWQLTSVHVYRRCAVARSGCLNSSIDQLMQP